MRQRITLQMHPAAIAHQRSSPLPAESSPASSACTAYTQWIALPPGTLLACKFSTVATGTREQQPSTASPSWTGTSTTIFASHLYDSSPTWCISCWLTLATPRSVSRTSQLPPGCLLLCSVLRNGKSFQRALCCRLATDCCLC